MKTQMAILITATVSLGGCDAPDNTFAVRDPAGRGLSAELQLCGRRQSSLQRNGQTFQASLPAPCEGEGRIAVRLRDGGEASCPIGYISPGLEQKFVFRLDGARCVAIPATPPS